MIHHQVIHFPIALVLVGVCFELASWIWRQARPLLEVLGLVFLVLGFLGLLAGVGTGLWVEDNYGDALIPTHRNFGIGALSASLLALGCQAAQVKFDWARALRTLFYLAAAVLVVVTGHYGGEMAHGEQRPTPKSQKSLRIPPPAKLPQNRRPTAGRTAKETKEDKEDDNAPIVLPPPGKVPARR